MNRIWFTDGSDVRTGVFDYYLKDFYSSYYPHQKSHNEMEYLAVKESLIYSHVENENMKVIIFTDSQLVTRQLIGEYKVNELRLKEFYDDILETCKMLKSIPEIYWIPREKNIAGIILDHGLKAKYNINEDIDINSLKIEGGSIGSNDI